jgi:hypothetical protein
MLPLTDVFVVIEAHCCCVANIKKVSNGAVVVVNVVIANVAAQDVVIAILPVIVAAGVMFVATIAVIIDTSLADCMSQLSSLFILVWCYANRPQP